MEEENDVWGVPFDSKTQATCEPGDNGVVPTSEKTTMREYSAPELVGLASSFKQKGKRVAACVLQLWAPREMILC